MSAGLPVVATDTGGIREVVIDGKTGFLAATGDVSTLAMRLVFLIENRQARLDMGRAARESLGSTYAQEKMQDAVSGLYKELLKE
jgi:glycosyltransferase involved in cell wall biosynthesis